VNLCEARTLLLNNEVYSYSAANRSMRLLFLSSEV